MKTDIQIFTSETFGEIRTCQVNNQIMFVGKDVATALGYSNVRDALNKHVDSEDKGVAKCDTLGGVQKFTVINESGLYSLILSSKLPQAKAFKRWVTAEVLPQIRKTGGYIPTRDFDGRELSGKEILERADEIVGCTLRLLNEPAEENDTEAYIRTVCTKARIHRTDKVLPNVKDNICKLAWAMAYVENGQTLNYRFFTQAFLMM